MPHACLTPASRLPHACLTRGGRPLCPSQGVFRERFAPRDIAWFKRVIKAFRVSLGLAGGEIHAMMATLTALLHLGNIDFTQADAGDATAVTEATAAHVEAAAACLGVADAAALRAELGLERIVMGGQEVSKQLDRARALSARDALCKATFGAVFVDVVARCNASVTGASAQASGRVGVLDIFGFENMQFNSLEQLCINYTNEKLHQIFINEVFETERRVYTEEGLDPGAINFTDNAMVLEMISGHNPHDADGRSGATAAEVRQKIKGSLFGILDDTCKQAKNRGEQYCEGAVAKWRGAKDANGELFEYKDQFAREKFKVVHFAGPVEYGVTEVDKEHFKPPSEWKRLGIQPGCAQIDSFVTKNKDRVPASLLAFLRTHATNAYYTHVAEQAEAAAEASEAAAAAASPSPAGGGSPQRGSPGGGGRGPKTIVAKFSREIEAFFTLLLSGADPKFIRTINPRPKGIPAPPTMGERFHLQRVLAQLRYTGILDTVRVRASGYLIRKRYEDFAPQFIHPCNLLPTAAQQRLQRADGGGGQVAISDHAMALRVRQEPALARQVVEALFEAPELGVTAGETRYGKTMVFIKRLATLATLEATKEARMQRVMRELMAQQRLAALGLGWWRRRGFEAQLRACALLQGAWRRWLELEGPRSRKGRWQALIDLHATFVRRAFLSWMRGPCWLRFTYVAPVLVAKC
jgi:myosin heavy subunit